MTLLSRLPMPRRRAWLSITLAASLMTGCLSDDDHASRYSTLIVFGDSLSDVGSYAVGAVASAHGGKYTVNSQPASAQNWTELFAAELGLPAPCAAQTGLDGNPALGLNVTPVDHPGCTSYAQGGARVTEPVGPNHKTVNADLGQLTTPVVTQIERHLARSGGQFKQSDAIVVFAGGNDFLWQSDLLAAGVINNLASQIQQDIQSGACVPADANASNCLGGAIDRSVAAQTPALVAAMELAGSQLARLVTERIVASGGRQVIVVNLPDVSKTPSAKGQPASVLNAVQAMVSAFNTHLSQGLAQGDSNRILQVDLAERFNRWAANPSTYGFSNFTDTACDLTKPTPNLLGSSLTCYTGNTIGGDVSRYAFADKVHPAPYTHRLMADFVLAEMSQRGWR
jgi:outer membrane lipase/esterase